MKKLLFLLLIILISFSLFFFTSKQTYAEGECTLTINPTPVNYGSNFGINLSVPGKKWANDGGHRFKLIITGYYLDPKTNDVYYREYDGDAFNSKDHTFSFNKDHEDDGDNMGKLSHLPPGIDSNGKQIARSYTVYGFVKESNFTEAFQNLKGTFFSADNPLKLIKDADPDISTCQEEITILPSNDPSAPPITIYPTLPPSQSGPGGYKLEPYVVINGQEQKQNSDGIVDGDTTDIHITFTGLPPTGGPGYRICLKGNQRDCTQEDDFDISDKKPDSGSLLSLTLEHLCGHNENSLKIKDEPCDPHNDYFHEGHMYTVGVYTPNFRAGPVAKVSFFVYHAYPHVYLLSNGKQTFDARDETFKNDRKAINPKDFPIIDNPLRIQLVSRYKAGKGNRNNYQIVLESDTKLLKGDKCVTLQRINETDGEAMVEFTSADFNIGYGNKIGEGKYLLKINEQDHEDDRTLGIGDSCQGGFTYYHIPIEVLLNEDKTDTIVKVNVNDVEKDPQEQESKQLGDETGRGPLPCAVWEDTKGEVVPTNEPERFYKCHEFETAVGPFGIRPQAFIKTLASFILGISILITIGYLIYGGYLILISRGDKEKIQKAREVITSCIIGLVFIILSFALLTIIGVDILRIPGFGR